MTDYLRMSGIYWSLTALDLMGDGHLLNKEDIIEFIKQCQDADSGGISPSVKHDPHMLYTLSAVQILCTYDAVNSIDVEGVVKYVSSLQQEDGSFTGWYHINFPNIVYILSIISGDKWGEVDTRFSFCAVACLSLLNRMDAINVEKAVDFVHSCMNFDGGFGSRPLSESHAGLIYCCVGFLSITGRLDIIDGDKLGWWLCERQLPSGGLNGKYFL